MKTIKYTLATLMVALVVAVVLVGCKKNTFESSGDFAMVENANSNGKGMGTGDVTVVLRGVKQYYTHTTPDGTTIVELYCVPPISIMFALSLRCQRSKSKMAIPRA